MYYFLKPELLWLAPALALGALALVLFHYLQRERALGSYGERSLIAPTSRPLARWRYLARALLSAFGAAALGLALARPVVEDGTRSIVQGKVDVVAVIDVSRSMAAMDYAGKVPPEPKRADPDAGERAKGKKPPVDDEPGSRLEMVRHILFDHALAAMDGNQMGIVSYAGKAHAQAFLTRDTNALRWIVDRGLTVSSAPGEGSSMARALELALDLFDADSPEDHERMIVLFSDGGSDDPKEKLLELAQECKRRGITVVVFGVGNLTPSPIPVSKLASDDEVAEALMHHGKKWYEADGVVEKTRLDAALLQELSKAAGGRYIQVKQASDVNLSDLVSAGSTVEVPGTRELFPLVLALALLLFVSNTILHREWRFGAASSPRKNGR